MQSVLQRRPLDFACLSYESLSSTGGSKRSQTCVCPLVSTSHSPYPNVLLTSSFPVLFFKPVTALIGPSTDVIIPHVAQPPRDHLPDYEVEFVIVIGKAAKNVSEADALDYVLGYTGANDVRNPSQPNVSC